MNWEVLSIFRKKDEASKWKTDFDEATKVPEANIPLRKQKEQQFKTLDPN